MRNIFMLMLIGLMVVPAFAVDQTKKPETAESLIAQAEQAEKDGKLTDAVELYRRAAVRYKDDMAKAQPILDKISALQSQMDVDVGAPEGLNGAPRIPHEPPMDGEVRELSLQRLGNFDYDADKGGNIPEDVQRLNGATVKLRGYMIPLDQTDRISRFVLVPDLFACCFGQPPQIQHTVTVSTPKGKAVAYYPDEIDCVGTLKVEEKTEDGFIISIFELDVTSVRPAPR